MNKSIEFRFGEDSIEVNIDGAQFIVYSDNGRFIVNGVNMTAEEFGLLFNGTLERFKETSQHRPDLGVDL